MSAIARSAGLQSKTLTGTDPVEFTSLWATPGAGYTPYLGNPASYEYIMLPGEGMYHAVFMIYWSTDFGASTFPFIEPSTIIGGTPGALSGDAEVAWDNTQGWIGGEQFIASEQDHHSLVAEIWFSFSTAYVPAMGIGVNIRSGFAGTKSVGGAVAVTRMGEPLVEVT